MDHTNSTNHESEQLGGNLTVPLIQTVEITTDYFVKIKVNNSTMNREVGLHISDLLSLIDTDFNRVRNLPENNFVSSPHNAPLESIGKQVGYVVTVPLEIEMCEKIFNEADRLYSLTEEGKSAHHCPYSRHRKNGQGDFEVVVCSDFSEFKKTWKDSEMADWSNSENISIPS